MFYAIGDIHGHLDLLRAAHERIATDRARHGTGAAPVVHLGDLVDRGPDSAGVIDMLRKGIAAGEPWVVLKGNHDRAFGLFLADPAAQDPGLRREFTWLHPRIGGAATLASYGVRAPADRPVAQVWAEARHLVPPADLGFLQGLPTSHLAGAWLCVHAGIRPGVALPDQTETDLLWIREPFLSYRGAHPWTVVHGHTAVPAPEHHGNRVNLDSGAAYGGPLTAVAIEGDAVWHLGAGGRVPLNPLATPLR
jgi:serine/threonine protein phosphatase 1